MELSQDWIHVQKRILQVILPVLRRLPARMGSSLLSWVGRCDYDLIPRQRRSYLEAARRGRHLLDGQWDDRHLGRALASSLAHWRMRDGLLDGLTDEDALSRFDVVGREHLDEAVACKKGVILLGNHFGAHMLPAHWLYRRSYPIRLFMERPRNVSRFMAGQFRADGPHPQGKLFISRRSTPAEAAASILRASKLLRAGLILNIASDVRWEGAHTAPATFLGRTFHFSTTWVMLAAMTGARVVPAFCRIADDGRYHLKFLPAYEIPSTTIHDDLAWRYVQRNLDAIANEVRLHPDQANDYFFWPDAEHIRAHEAPH